MSQTYALPSFSSLVAAGRGPQSSRKEWKLGLMRQNEDLRRANAIETQTNGILSEQ
jgi:hypothetical protein